MAAMSRGATSRKANQRGCGGRQHGGGDDALARLVHALRQMRGIEDFGPSVTAPIAWMRKGDVTVTESISNLAAGRADLNEPGQYSQNLREL